MSYSTSPGTGGKVARPHSTPARLTGVPPQRAPASRSKSTSCILTSISHEAAPQTTSNSVSLRKSKERKPKERKPKIADPIRAIIPLLPVYTYKDPAWSSIPEVEYIWKEDEVDDRISALKGPLGFDLEWWVEFYGHGVKPTHHPTGLVQIGDKTKIYLIHVSRMRVFPERLKQLIEDESIIKIGVNILQDGNKLKKDFGIIARGLLEFAKLARATDPP